MIPKARTRARRGDGDLLRDEIVAATTTLLAETGDIAAVSIRAIAEAVGVTPPSIYLHFADKSELLFAVCEDRFRELDRRSQAAAATADNPVDEVCRRGEAYIRFGLENPEHYRVLFMDRDPVFALGEARTVSAAAFGHMVDAVQRCIDGGFIDTGGGGSPDDAGGGHAGSGPGAPDAVVITVGLWASVHGLTSLLVAKPHFPWPPLEQLIAHVLATCARGLGAGKASAG